MPWIGSSFGRPPQVPSPYGATPSPYGQASGGSTPQSSSSSFSGSSKAPSALDSSYYATVAKLKFQRNQQLATLDRQGKWGKEDYQKAISRLAPQQAQAVQTTRQGANREGLLYSGQLQYRLNGPQGVNTLYAQRQGDLTQGYKRDKLSRRAARDAIKQGYPLDVAAQKAAAADRAAQSDMARLGWQ